MKKLIYILLCLVITACSDDMYVPADTPAEGHVMRFEAVVVDEPQTRGQVLDVYDNDVTRDFNAGDSFGMFIIDADGNFVSTIDGKNAKNLRLTTPDGKAWNLNSSITEVVHKFGYRYVAYYPYSEAFNNCSTTAEINALLTAPAYDQSAEAATDWMYTEVTAPQTNAVTTLAFRHRYAKIDIYHSFTQDHSGSWTTAYPFTKTVDDNNVEHYRYLLDATSPQTLSVKGKYTIGNYLTGIKEMAYDISGIAIENGRHSIVYTYGMDERCAIDLGLPSGIRWSPINLGAETATYMDDAAIASVSSKIGKRLAWGELFEKDTYSYDSYIDDPYLTATTLLPSDITRTVHDPVTQYWGGHWSLPSADDLKEFIDNVETVSTETVYSPELGKDINMTTFRSKINGNTITMPSNGYANNASIVYNQYIYYMSASRSGTAYFTGLTTNTLLKTTTSNRYSGVNIRPVLKAKHVFTYAERKDIIVRHIDDLAVDLGITKTVTEDGMEVKYKVLWSPFNYGVESKVDLQTYNRTPVDEEAYILKCTGNLGMRLAWGDIEEPAKFNKTEYNNSAIATKYLWNRATGEKNVRDLLKEDDIVQLNWPSGWYIPTAEDFDLLLKNVTITKETISSRTWFRLTGKGAYSGKSILIPATSYIDNAANTEKWGADTYLQSSTIGNGSGEPVQYALNINSSAVGQVVGTAGRATGLMIRPVRYVRVE